MKFWNKSRDTRHKWTQVIVSRAPGNCFQQLKLWCQRSSDSSKFYVKEPNWWDNSAIRTQRVVWYFESPVAATKFMMANMELIGGD